MLTIHQRRKFFLLAALILPAGVLLAVALRMVAQERELTARRQVEARQAATAQLGRELIVELERTRLQSATPSTQPDPAVILAAHVRDNTVRMPWQHAPHEAAAAHIAQLLHARNLTRAGQPHEAETIYRSLAQLPLDVVDEEGMPIALYGADWLTAHGEPWPRQLLDADHARLGPIALHALHDLLGNPGGGEARAARLRIAQQLKRTEQLLALERELPGLRAAAARNFTPTRGSVWLAYGAEPWLVGFARDDSLLVVVDAARLLERMSAPVAAGARLFTAAAAGAEPLDAGLPGLYAAISDDVIAADVLPLRSRLLLLALLFAAGVTAFAVYLGLRDARRETRAAELRSQFVSSVSHELKTPLTSIRMFAEMLRMSPETAPEERVEYLDTIVNESERLSRLINNVLDFSRIERDEQQYRLTPVSLSALVDNVARAMAYPFQQAGLRLNVQAASDLPAVRADRDAMEQALLNLLSNAIKYSRGAPDNTVDLEVERVNGCAYIRVRDRGRGIAQTEQARVFEKFYRSPEVERDGIPGTGLGLALVAHVARGHGGDVEVSSAAGSGSTFSIRLPLEPA